MDVRHPVTFQPGGQTVWVPAGATVLAAARAAGITIEAPCGGRGICGGCGVRVLEGALEAPNSVERAGLARAQGDRRLACHALVAGPVSVRPVVVAAGRPQPSAAQGEVIAAVDLGTTGVGAVVVERSSGREVGRATVRNSQGAWGADVVSRVSASIDGAGPELSRAAWTSVRHALHDAGMPNSGVERLVIAGNTAMTSLLIGADVTSLGSAPFAVPAIGLDVATPARAHGLLAPGGSVLVVPPIASFVGGDTLAGIAATGMLGADAVTLLVDIGTNAEVVLSAHRRLVVASAPAGPAFEGGGIMCGGPAIPGAVSGVVIDDDHSVSLTTIGDMDPLWFSGAGFISAVAELRRAGHIGADGLLRAAGPLEDRFLTDASGVLCVRLGGSAEPLMLSQLDIRALQLAKAAVRVAIEGVVLAARVKMKAVAVVLVAGAFGGALRARDIVDIGMVPRSLMETVTPVGNTSLAGALSFAWDPEMLAVASDARESFEHVDLALDPGFNDRLMDALALEPWL